MESRATANFWRLYDNLPKQIQERADKQFEIWVENHAHPSVQFKKIRSVWSVRVTDDYRVLGIAQGDTIIWFGIGNHDDYEQLLRRV